MTQPEKKSTILHSYHCICGKLLFKGFLLDSTIQIKCKKCGELMSFQGRNDHTKPDDYYALMLNQEGDIVSASSNIQKLFGYRLSELLSKNYGDLLPKVASKASRVDFKQMWLLQNKERYFFKSKITLRRKNDEVVVGTAQSKFVTTATETFLFNAFYPDGSSPSTQADSEFFPLQEYPFFSRISVGGICLDASVTRRDPNRRPANEIIGKPFTTFMKESKQIRQAFLQQLRLGKPFGLLRKKFEGIDGNTVCVDTHFVPNFNEKHECVDYSVYVFDRDLLKRYEHLFALNSAA